MKKAIITVLILVTMMIFIFAGCGKSESEYGVLTKVGDKLYEVTFDEYAENYAAANEFYTNKYFASHNQQPGCSSIYRNGILARNLDWYIKQDGIDVCETIIRTTANEGRYATIGVMLNTMVTDETYNSLSQEQLKMLPFALSDGMNSEGLMFGQNACPGVDGVSVTTGTNPGGENLVTLMLGREILDYCANVDEAIDFLRSKNCHSIQTSSGSSAEAHFLLADKERAVVIEFVDNEIVVIDQDDFPDGQTFCTNHYLFCGEKDTGHGSGFERDAIIRENYDSITDWRSGMDLLEKLKYSNAYTIPFGEKFWYSEFYTKYEANGVVYDFNTETPKDNPEFLNIIQQQIEADGRLQDDCWWSSHSSAYDSASKTLHLVVRENFDKVYDFSLQK